MKSYALPLGLLVATSCADVSALTSSPRAAAPALADDSLLFGSGTPEQAWRLFWRTVPPAERHAGQKAIASVYTAHGERFPAGKIALTDRDLPGGAVALIVPDPDSPEGLLTILSSSIADHRTFLRANEAAAAVQSTGSRERLSYVTSRGTVHRLDPDALASVPPGRRAPSDLARALERGAMRISERHLPEIGAVRILDFLY